MTERIHRVDASGILISTRGGTGLQEWYLLPRSAMGAEVGTRLGEWARDTVREIGDYLAVDGADQIFLYPGPRSADTREGALWSIPLGALTPQRRIATGLNHPRAIAIDDDYMWIVEEGSLGTHGANGRILRAPR